MIKFFRKIRQRLLTENRFSKYLIYAIGEIILVVIGILIALQINNWNENQKLKRTEQALLLSLEQEIAANVFTIKFFIKRNDSVLRFSKALTDSIYLDYNTLKEKSITGSLNYFPLKLQTPVLDNILSNNSNLKTSPQNIITELRSLNYRYQEIDNMLFYLDELWNSKITEFFIATGLSYQRSTKLNAEISLKELETYGYTTRQFASLLDAANDLLILYVDYQKKALKDSEKMLKSLPTKF